MGIELLTSEQSSWLNNQMNMKANHIERAKVFQKSLDESMVEVMTSGWMDEYGDKFIQYSGGDTVMVADISMDGLADYDRNLGFNRGGVSLSYSPYKFTQDRGRTFMIDSMDVDETSLVASSGVVLGEFQREHVAPEIDCYRYSKIAKIAIENDRASFGYSPKEDTMIKKLLEDIKMIRESVGMSTELVITIPVSLSDILFDSNKIKMGSSGDALNMNTVVQSINGIPIVIVPSDRLKTDYIFKSGLGDQAAGGYEVSGTAKNINWIIAAKKSILAVTKAELPRIFSPEENILADAWKIDYRRYHDLWVLKKKLNGIWVNIRETK